MKQVLESRLTWVVGLGAIHLALLVLLLTGCSLIGIGSKDGTKEYDLIFEASPKLNSCGGEFGNALVVRVYELNSDLAISIVSLAQLWDNEDTELADQLLNQQETVLEPNQAGQLELETEAEYLAVVGNFCQTEGKCWLWIRKRKDLEDKIQLSFGETCIESLP